MKFSFQIRPTSGTKNRDRRSLHIMSRHMFCIMSRHLFCLISRYMLCLRSRHMFRLMSHHMFCLISRRMFCLLSRHMFCLMFRHLYYILNLLFLNFSIKCIWYRKQIQLTSYKAEYFRRNNKCITEVLKMEQINKEITTHKAAFCSVFCWILKKKNCYSNFTWIPKQKKTFRVISLTCLVN